MTTLPAPDAILPFGVHVWFVPGGVEVLQWGGPHDMVRRCPLIIHAGGMFAGAPVESVSVRCVELADAQRAVAAWIGGPS